MNSNQDYRVLLLTSTVTPSVASSINDVELRKREYIAAIEYYLNSTPFRIVIVDNSDYDFSQHFQDERLECRHYMASSEDSAYGKGFGEAKILMYAFHNSAFIGRGEQIIKITGRHIIKNLHALLAKCKDKNTVYVDVDTSITYARSYFFVAPKEFYNNHLFENSCFMNDSKGVHMEHMLAKSIKEWKAKGCKHKMFLFPIWIIGRGGGTTTYYKKPSLNRYARILIKYVLYSLI